MRSPLAPIAVVRRVATGGATAVCVATFAHCSLISLRELDDPTQNTPVVTPDADDAAEPPPEASGGGPDAANRDPIDALSDATTDARLADRGSLPGKDGSSDGASDATATADSAKEDAPSCTDVTDVWLTPTRAMASTSRSPNVAANAVDGDFTTRWESVQSLDVDGASVDPQWIYLDFGAPVSVREVEIDWERACASDYQLQVSMNASSWTTMPNGTITDNILGSMYPPTDWSPAVDTQGLSGVGRYLRVFATARCQPLYGDSIWEMRVSGHLVSACPEGG
jgi:F5/8 type C domain-containing protein